MKKLILYSFFLFLLVFGISEAQAQFLNLQNKIKLEVTDATLNTADTTIQVKYYLKAAKRRYYSTKLFYSNNGGNSFKGPLRSIQGDIGDSTRPGNEKIVSWRFRQDNPYFDGKNIMFKVEVVEVPKIANGGPESALLSLMVPGLGDGKVRNGYNYGWITALSYGSLATSAIFYIRSEQKYKDYRERVANSEEDHQSLFNTAKSSQNLARGFLIAGAGIWAADVIGVYFRGLKNKRRLQREKEKAEEEKNEGAWLMPRKNWNHLIPQISPYSDGRFNQVALLWKF